MTEDLPKWMLRCPKCNHLMPAAAEHVTGVEGKTMGNKVQSRCRNCDNTVIAGLERGPGQGADAEGGDDAGDASE